MDFLCHCHQRVVVVTPWLGCLWQGSNFLRLLRRTMHGTSTESKKRAFVMLVEPHLEYTAPVWSPPAQRDIETLEYVQWRATHWICSKWDRPNQKWSKTYEEARMELSRPSILDRDIFLTLCQIFEIIHFLDCINFNYYFSYSSRPSHSHNQSLHCLSLIVSDFHYCQCSLFVDSLPPQITTDSYLLFKSCKCKYLLQFNYWHCTTTIHSHSYCMQESLYIFLTLTQSHFNNCIVHGTFSIFCALLQMLGEHTYRVCFLSDPSLIGDKIHTIKYK